MVEAANAKAARNVVERSPYTIINGETGTAEAKAKAKADNEA